MYLYKIGTQSDVLIKESVLISEGSFKKNSTVYLSKLTVNSRSCGVIKCLCFEDVCTVYATKASTKAACNFGL